MSRRTATTGSGGSGAGEGREGRATRDIILDAAEQHFAACGFAGVSLREIATDAGLKNPASLYTHFRNKRALYESVLARGLDPISRVIALSGRGGQAPSMFLDRVLDCLIAHPRLPCLIQRAALDDGVHLRTALTVQLRPLYGTGMTSPTRRCWPRLPTAIRSAQRRWRGNAAFSSAPSRSCWARMVRVNVGRMT
jgi:AcrR family transcriptional regulator